MRSSELFEPPMERDVHGAAKRFTYSIGDIHGRLDLLVQAVDLIYADVRSRDGIGRVILLGDYVDRGPDSRGVVELLMAAQEGASVICLRGNHEEMMLRACKDRFKADIAMWIENGGDETLRSYGGEGGLADLDLIPDGHLDWLEQLPPMKVDQHRAFVHAGVMPGVRIADQEDAPCLWIREKFLRAHRPSDFPDRKHIVHGHTPLWAGKPDATKPELLAHRTNLDTAAFVSGILTIGVFDHDRPGGPISLLSAELQ